MVKNEKGITLVALVLTLIVLLVLSGFTLTLTLEKNGIINKAKYAREVSTNDQEATGQGLNNLYNELVRETNSIENNSTGPKPIINKGYAYTGSVQTFTIPYSGTYKLEVWGAQGGTGTVTAGIGGNGGYSCGKVMLNQGQIIYIYVGGQANNYTGGFNGGGNGGLCTNNQHGEGGYAYAGGGGGATDIRTSLSDLNSRIIVAGGGGGSGRYDKRNGGTGGGLSGNSSSGVIYSSTDGSGGGGTKTSGGQGGSRGSNGYQEYVGVSGILGQGANGIYMGSSFDTNPYPTAGGGGGYYGGGSGGASGSWGGAPGGGGSGYIGGVQDGQTIAGNASMPSTSGSTEIGNSGNGYAKITLI